MVIHRRTGVLAAFAFGALLGALTISATQTERGGTSSEDWVCEIVIGAGDRDSLFGSRAEADAVKETLERSAMSLDDRFVCLSIGLSERGPDLFLRDTTSFLSWIEGKDVEGASIFLDGVPVLLDMKARRSFGEPLLFFHLLSEDEARMLR